MDNIKNIIESLLFVSDKPLKIEQIKDVLEDAETKEIRNALSEMAAEYNTLKSSFYLSEVANGFQLRTPS